MESCPHYLMHLNLIRTDENGKFIIFCDRCYGWWRTTAGYGRIVPRITSARKRDGTPIPLDDLLKPEKELKGD